MKPEVSILAQKILTGIDSGREVETELHTSQRIIARVTDGIYREPWAAFRELIANAYDADASRVIIDSGAPDFKHVTVRDNGRGMSAEALAYVLNSIGGSSKRTTTGKSLETVNEANVEFSPGGRPLIGKIGIGLFAVAQLTQHFQIITKSKKSTVRHSATIKLQTHSELNSPDPDKEFIAGTAAIISETVDESEYDKEGTTIVLYDLRDEIVDVLRSARRWKLLLGPDSERDSVQARPAYHIGVLPGQLEANSPPIMPSLPWPEDATPAEKMQSVLEAASRGTGQSKAPTNLVHFDEYFRVLWNLALSLPLPYINADPLEKSASEMMYLKRPKGRGEEAIVTLPEGTSVRQYFDLPRDPPFDTFDVYFDDVLLRRPIDLPNTLRRPSRLPSPMMLVDRVAKVYSDKNIQRAGGQLSFHGYLYWNSQIIPKETSGVLIRVRGASGTLFDKTFLNYQVSEQNRLSQITCEIFVDEGLDPAINIDRESFNYSHPHFIYIQKWLHLCLRTLINRNKRLAAEDLKVARARESRQAESRLIKRALDIWFEVRGFDADPPFDLVDGSSLPRTVGDAEIDWRNLESVEGRAETLATAIVLESYSLLSEMDMAPRTSALKNMIELIGEIKNGR